MKTFEKYKYPIFLILVIIAVSLFGSKNTAYLDIQEDKVRFELSDIFTCEVPYDTIKSISIQEMPEEGDLISGGAKRSTHYGMRHNEEWGDYTLCINTRSKKCIVFNTTEGVFVVSYESTPSTESLYDAFVDYFDEYDYDIEYK